MNQAPHAIREQNIDLLGFNESGYLALAESRMHHGLSSAIGARHIIRRAYLRRPRARGAALIRNARAADRTTDARNSSLFADRGYDMSAFLAALDAHLFDTIAGGEGRFLDCFHVQGFYCCHNAPPLGSGVQFSS